jgi:hypothetical protein
MKPKRNHTTARGDLMRRIAALHAQIADVQRKHLPDETRHAEVEQLKGQIVDLERLLTGA